MSFSCRHRRALAAAAFLAAVGAHGQAASADMAARPRPPAVWIVTGLPGDPERETRYLATVQALRAALEGVFDVPRSDIRVLFGQGKPSPHPACTADALFREIERLNDQARSGRALWLFLLGHGATAKDHVSFHLQGRDVSGRELADRLADVSSRAPLTIVLTHSASGNLVPLLRGPNRTLVAAAPPGVEDNETEFPHLLAEVLGAPSRHDTNGDGMLSVLEMTEATRDLVTVWYQDRGLLVTEQAVVDGNGDGVAAAVPHGDDERCARAAGLVYR